MSPYKSLLVLALAACIVTPVLSAEAAASLGKNEERAGTHLVKRQSRPPPPMTAAELEGTPTSKMLPYIKKAQAVVNLAIVGLVGGLIYEDVEANKKSRDISRRKERSFGRGMPVDISEDRSSLDITRRTSSRLELLNRAVLGEALSLFGRMLDELD